MTRQPGHYAAALTTNEDTPKQPGWLSVSGLRSLLACDEGAAAGGVRVALPRFVAESWTTATGLRQRPSCRWPGNAPVFLYRTLDTRPRVQ